MYTATYNIQDVDFTFTHNVVDQLIEFSYEKDGQGSVQGTYETKYVYEPINVPMASWLQNLQDWANGLIQTVLEILAGGGSPDPELTIEEQINLALSSFVVDIKTNRLILA